MSMNALCKTPYQAAKIKRAIQTAKEKYTFTQLYRNEFGELDKTRPREEIEIQGILHVSSSYQTRINADSTTVASKESPMILTDLESALKVKYGALMTTNGGTTYRVIDVINLGELGIIGEISLEVVKND